MPEVDVIIPCRAPAPWLGDAVRSALADDVDVGVRVVDDGSSDHSVADCLATIDDRRVQLTRQSASGPSAARNRARSMSTAHWHLYLDADDMLLPGGLSALLQLARLRSGIAIGSWQDVNESATQVLAQRILPEDDAQDALATACSLRPPAGTWLVPNSSVPWDESRRVWEVTRFLNRLAAEVSTVVTTKALVARMRQHDSVTRLSLSERHFSGDVEAAFLMEEYAWMRRLGEPGLKASGVVAARLLALVYASIRDRDARDWIASVNSLAKQDDWKSLLSPRLGSAAWTLLHLGLPGLHGFARVNRFLGR